MTTKFTPEEVKQVGNLAEDDEWLGLAVELGIVMRCAIRESVKSNVRDFTGKDDYKIGDLSKEADARVKAAVADLRGKDEYELGDLSAVIDQIAKDEVRAAAARSACNAPALARLMCALSLVQVCKMTGKEEYEAGDLTVEVDKRVKSAGATLARPPRTPTAWC